MQGWEDHHAARDGDLDMQGDGGVVAGVAVGGRRVDYGWARAFAPNLVRKDLDFEGCLPLSRDTAAGAVVSEAATG